MYRAKNVVGALFLNDLLVGGDECGEPCADSQTKDENPLPIIDKTVRCWELNSGNSKI